MSTRARAFLSAAVLTIATTLAPGHLTAQDYASSAGWGGGFISYKPFVAQGEHSPSEIGLSSWWVAQATAESWQFDRWVGLRLGGSFSRGAVEFPTANRDVSTWGLEVAALLRVLPPSADRSASAYLIGGGGLMWFGLGDGGSVPIAGTNLIYDDADRRQLMALGGGGIEVLTGMRALDGRIGVRVEAVDLVTFGGPFSPVDGPAPGMSHNLRVSLMLFSAVPGLF